MVTRARLLELGRTATAGDRGRTLGDLVGRHPAVAHLDEPLRVVVNRMADAGLTRFPVVDRTEPRRLLGMISLSDLLKARVLNLEAERPREQVLPLHLLVPWRSRAAPPPP